ncbi:putative ribonuclease H-like domain-containing protein [Tanacetum coccineum]
MAFVSSPSSTNEVNTAYGVSTNNMQVSNASTQVSIASTQSVSTVTSWDNQDNSRRTINVEEISSKSMFAIDGAGFDWSYMVDDEVHTNMALMAFSDSEVHNDKTCSKTCLKSFETLKTQLDDLRIEFNKSEFNLANYKRALASVKEQLFFYKKNEIEKFDNASKSLEKLIKSQIPDKSRMGLGFVSYNAVPPPPTGLFAPPNLDLSHFVLEEFQQPKFEGYGPKTSRSVSEDTSNKVRETPDAPLVEELMSNDKLEKKTNFPTIAKINFVRPKQQEKPVRKPGHPQKEDQGYVNSGCSRHMTGNMSYLSDFKEFDGGYTFGGGAKGGKITSKGTLKTDKLDFEDVYFFKELQFNLFSVSQMCDKKNSVLFINTRCFVLSPDFKLADESQVLLKVPKNNNMYSVDMKNIIPKKSLTCLVAKATLDESMLWHRRLGHVNFKTINKLVKDKLVRGLPTKHFENDQTYVACLKGKQHKASCKTKIPNSITQPLFMLHIDLFGPTFVSNLMNKKYCLVITDDYSIFAWVFFLASKDETSGILKSFITQIENLVDKRNRVLVVKPYNKTPYELFRGRTFALDFMRPFGCHVTILNTLDYLGKFDGKSDDGFFVGYSLNSKAFRVYNIRTKRVEENVHIIFLEDKTIIAGDKPKWLLDIDTRDHPLEQVCGNPTMPVQTRRQLATDPEMCMFTLTMSIVEPKNIKEAMADSAWIEAMQDELH